MDALRKRTADGLWIHIPTGWVVDPTLGYVYQTRGTGKGRRLGGKPNQHGQLRANRRTSDGKTRQYLIHNVVWEVATNAPVPRGMMIVHVDGDQTNCRSDNLTLQPRRVLSPSDITEIRSSNDGDTALAERYGINRGTVWRIRSGESWN